MKKLISLLITFSLFSFSFSQENIGMLKGKITDQATGEDLPFVNLILSQNDKPVKGQVSDVDGKYTFDKLMPGVYKLEVNFVGYQKFSMDSIQITVNKITFLDVKLYGADVQMDEFVVVGRNAPLIDRDGGKAHRIMQKEEIRMMPGRNAGSIAAMVGGVQVNGNGISSVRGSRAESGYYYIDGIKTKATNESYDKITENKFINVNKEPLSTFSIDVDKASYSNMRRFINQGELPPKNSVRIEEMINYFDYEYPQPTGKHPFSITTEYTNCPWNEDNKLVSIALQGKEIDMKDAPANNLVFLLDVSGSMSSYNKLGLLKAGLELLIDELREDDKVSIVVYAGAAGVILKPTSGDKKEKIKNALNQLQAGGSTAGGKGIELAYKIAKKHFIKRGNNRVILATDGDFNVGISGDDELIKLIEKKRDQDIFLSVLGFGTGNYKDSKMEKIADKGNGNYAYIDNILEAKKVLVKEMGGTLLTIAKDVKLQIEFNPTHVRSYRLVGYENRKLNNEDFNNDKKDAGELGSGHTVTALYEIVPAGSKSREDTDALKYQLPTLTSKNSNPNEILTVKFRYKEPKETESKLISHVVYDEYKDFENASENLKFSSSVIQFGMLLRNSNYKGKSNYQGIIKLAKSAKGRDDEGYRAEFIKLVETAELIKKELVLEED
ncbi:MAG: von Willebrand factor type A domain-containing protein [Flavobacteriales bacterium]